MVCALMYIFTKILNDAESPKRDILDPPLTPEGKETGLMWPRCRMSIVEMGIMTIKTREAKADTGGVFHMLSQCNTLFHRHQADL